MIARQVAEREASHRAEQVEAGRPFLGQRGVLRQCWSERAKTPEKRREPIPRVSGKGAHHNAALSAFKAFDVQYRAAMEAWNSCLQRLHPLEIHSRSGSFRT